MPQASYVRVLVESWLTYQKENPIRLTVQFRLGRPKKKVSVLSSEHSLEEQTRDNEFCSGTEGWAPCPGWASIAEVTSASVSVLL